MYSAAANVFEIGKMTQYLEKEEFVFNSVKNLSEAIISEEYIIKDIKADDEDLKNFLFTLGCFKGELVTVISILAENYVITVKDARYSIDADLAKAIIV